MKSTVKSIILISIVLLICVFSSELYAGSGPPDPGGDPSGGGPPVGGGAPIGNGTFTLISAGLLYITYKIFKLRRNYEELED